MKAKQKKVCAFLSVLIFTMSLGSIVPALAEEDLDVEIGDVGSSVGRHAHEHDMTVESLKQGKTEYLLGSGRDGNHRVTLTKQQIADILNGTTIIVQTDNSGEPGSTKPHQHKVTITLKAEKEERSGW